MDITRKEKTILVVEDDQSINRLITYNLCQSGFGVESVYDGFAALEKLKNAQYDVVVLDVMLPGIDGFHICKAIKEDPVAFKTFVVMLSAKAESQDKIYGNLVGADQYLTKPFSMAQLMATVNELIGMRDKDYSLVEYAATENKGGGVNV